MGIVFVVSAPSGAGKTTLCNALRERPDFVYSVSCTTRKPRRGEIDGEDYHFLAHEDFESRIKKGDFLEYAKVHDNYYGTLKSAVLKAIETGKDVLLDIDVQGAELIRSCTDPAILSALVDIFMMTPSFTELDRRLRKRATESEDQIQIRLQNARDEVQNWRKYKYIILSGSIEEDLDKFRAIMKAEGYRSARIQNHDFEK